MRIILKKVETLLYNITDIEKLQILKSKCQELETLARESAPTTGGLVTRPSLSSTLVARKAKLKRFQTNISSLDNISKGAEKDRTGSSDTKLGLKQHN